MKIEDFCAWNCMMDPETKAMPHGAANYTDPDRGNHDSCGQTRIWWIFLFSSLLCPVVLAIVVGLIKLIWIFQRIRIRNQQRYYLTTQRNEHASTTNNWQSWTAQYGHFCARIISAQSYPGKVLMVLEFVVGMISLCIYLYNVSWKINNVENCSRGPFSVDWYIDFTCNIILMVTFGLRLCGSARPFVYLLDLNAIANYCTVPPAFLSLITHRHWIGFRCARAYHIMSVSEILQTFGLLTTRPMIRLAQSLCLITTILLACSGVFHLLENSGDFWLNQPRIHNLSYFESVYFSFVTLSTVGYGDINPETTLGRLFCCVFVMTSLALFASTIPEVYLLYCNRKRFGGNYRPENGIGHVVVTGRIDASFMSRFLSDFCREDRRRDDVRVVFVGHVPDVEMESVLKHYGSTVVYLEGSLMQIQDLRRAQLHHAMACFVITDKSSPSPVKEDLATVMLVTSIKNFHPHTRCIVQLLQNQAKPLLLNIPGFALKRGDTIVCFQEIEYGLIAQSCIAPGASTLLANLIQSPSRNIILAPRREIIQDFVYGSQLELFVSPFGAYFLGMKYTEAAEQCFTKLHLLLIGLFRPERDNRKQGLLLCPVMLVITEDRVGIFVAKSSSDVSRVRHYCSVCHRHETDPQKITHCKCSKADSRPVYPAIRNPFERLLKITGVDLNVVHHHELARPPRGFEAKILGHLRHGASVLQRREENGILEDPAIKRNQRQFDISKAFHWCPTQTFRSVFLTRSDAVEAGFHDHILVLVMCSAYDSPIGLRDLVMPLRSSKIPYTDLKEIVFLGDPVFLEKEWRMLHNFPRIRIVPGDALGRADLRAANVHSCSSCVILSAGMGTSADKTLDDRAAILATLNIKAMVFENDEPLIDRSRRISGHQIPVITEIQHDSNIRLLDQYAWTEHDEDCDDVFLSEPYMCGSAVTLSSLDSMLVATYYNPLAVPLIRYLLWGFQSPFFESVLSEGLGLIPGDNSSDNPANQSGNSVGIRLVALDDEIFAGNQMHFSTYGALFVCAVRIGVICLGLARLMYPNDTDSQKTSKRCVLTNPPKEYPLRPDDLVYLLSQ
ncbi:calcium-activated potassium channel slowpoke-like [Paramacrobiotus metropolitanus]|uniref:calcium-activated potassium channel slowpoke-like n=1 Tax=Paramacrobiotus metropolitanus TaxID=2943436 RepID=UPI00244647E9|nr:calcium-activated potassium channel slowpoke-like [Paramacrobiotus metropolitanus]